MIALRPYQDTLVADVRRAMARHRRVLAVAPTGAGKTVVFTYIASSAVAKSKRVTIVAHRIEIVTQISLALDRMGVRHGRIWPGNSETGDLVQVAMAQTLARRLDALPHPDLLVIDEAHHAAAGQWDTIAARYEAARILGVTATPIRLDGKGLGNCFDTMVIGPRMRWLIDNGFLADYDYLAPPQQADFSQVKTRMGDYAVDALAEIMDQATITGDAVATYAKHLGGRPAIVFCITVAHAEHVAAQFRASGWRAASVDGSMDKAARRDLIAAIGDGRLHVLTSCQIISEGTDIPAVAGAIMLRPTKSLSLYLQSAGRALRPKADGGRALIIDHVGNVYRHGMPCEDREWSLSARKKKEKAPPIAQCETCFRAFPSTPGWKAKAACPSGEVRPEGCILDAKPAERIEIEHVDGELVAVGKADVIAARKVPLREAMRDARSQEDLERIAIDRGYKPGWVAHVMRERAARSDAGRQQVPA